MTLEQTVYNMLIENTGTHLLDSGGSNGRAWQQNQNKTLEDFRNEPEAILSFYSIDRDEHGNVTKAYPEISVSVFHKLTSGILWLDEKCREYNELPCKDWDSSFYGVSDSQYDWLYIHGFEAEGKGFNTYNWDNNFSQILQGQDLTNNGENYVLLQIHGGADARGGYTNAKLFKLSQHCEHYSVVTDDCSFAVEDQNVETKTKDMFTGGHRDNLIGLDWRGEWIDWDGRCATDDDIAQIAQITDGQDIHGHQNNEF